MFKKAVLIILSLAVAVSSLGCTQQSKATRATAEAVNLSQNNPLPMANKTSNYDYGPFSCSYGGFSQPTGIIDSCDNPIYDNPVYRCNDDSDCVSETDRVMGSCFYPCGLFPEAEDDCSTAPRCGVANKYNTSPMDCEIGHPCREPSVIRCLNNRCVGKWEDTG